MYVELNPGVFSVNLPFLCSFEMEDICGYEQSQTDEFDWSRRSGSTPSTNTGPSSAFNGQFYMYIETSDPRRLNDTAL